MAGELAADVAVAVEGFAAVRGVFVLAGRADDVDAYEFAVVLDPFEQRTLVQAHYAIVSATDSRRGHILYVNGADPSSPVPMRRARVIELTRQERDASRLRVAERRAARRRHGVLAVEPDPFAEIDPAFRASMTAAFEQLRDQTTSSDPYRSAVSVDLRTGVIAVVSDPFPSAPRPRILIIDEDTDTANTLRACRDFEITHVDEGWAGVEAVENTEYDAVLCALRVGAMSGASIHRLIAKTRPALAPRIAFLASARSVANAPESSALGRVLALPVTIERVRALLA